MSTCIIRGLVFLLAVSCRTAFSQVESSPWTTEEVQKILQQRVEVDRQCVGIAVGLVDATGKRFVGAGKLDKRDGSATPDGDTVFEIGSVTKVFTTLVLADMVVRGEIVLDAPVSEFLPEQVKLPTRGDRKITLFDLATHTSALPSMPANLTPADAMNPFADYSVDQMYAALSECKLSRDIGQEYEYSNLGMGLLGHILALKAGEDYETLVAKRITQPLGMKDTSIKLSDSMLSRLATGHSETLDEAQNWDLPTLAGAGALRSTASDMLTFVETCMGRTNSPLSEAIALQTESRHPTGTPNLSIALAWHLLEFQDVEICWHNGQTGGYHSFVGFDKKRDVGVVVLANTVADIDDIGLHLLNRQIPLRKFTAKKSRTAIQLDRSLLDGYVGEYELTPEFVITITRQDDQLMLQATGQLKLPLFAESEGVFFLKAVDAQITFVRDEAGSCTGLVLHQAGADQPAKKRSR